MTVLDRFHCIHIAILPSSETTTGYGNYNNFGVVGNYVINVTQRKRSHKGNKAENVTQRKLSKKIKPHERISIYKHPLDQNNAHIHCIFT